jgi:hypothetical protein
MLTSDRKSERGLAGLTNPRIGAVKQKILLLLLGGLALGLSGSPKNYFKVVNGMVEGWRKINRMSLRRAIKSLYLSKLVRTIPGKNGELTLVLSNKGEKKVLSYNLTTLQLKVPKKWDGKWRIVMFDIPEHLKVVRESLRFHLNEVGFLKLQKSAFIHPSDCQDVIEYLVEFYNIRQFVRFIIADTIDNELHFKHKFGLKNY